MANKYVVLKDKSFEFKGEKYSTGDTLEGLSREDLKVLKGYVEVYVPTAEPVAANDIDPAEIKSLKSENEKLKAEIEALKAVGAKAEPAESAAAGGADKIAKKKPKA